MVPIPDDASETTVPEIEPNASSPCIIVVGAGLAGLSAAHAALEHSNSRVLVLDRMPRRKTFCCPPGQFPSDAIQNEDLPRPMSCLWPHDSTDDLELTDSMRREADGFLQWLGEKCAIPASPPVLPEMLVEQQPRCGWRDGDGTAISKALLSSLEQAEKTGVVDILWGARVTSLVLSLQGGCIGCRYSRHGEIFEQRGPVILCTGGYGSDRSARSSLIAQQRPDLFHLPSACCRFSAGDGVKLAIAVGAKTIDLNSIHVAPTGLAGPGKTACRIAPDVLRRVGGVLLNQDGVRFCSEIDSDEEIVIAMWRNRGPFRLVLSAAAAAEVERECAELVQFGHMTRFENGRMLASDMQTPLSRLEASFRSQFEEVEQTGDSTVKAIPGSAVKSEPFYVAFVTPCISHCLGGLSVGHDGRVKASVGGSIPGLLAAGEISGGLRESRSAGNAGMLESLIMGRVSGRVASEILEGGSDWATEQGVAIEKSTNETEPAVSVNADEGDTRSSECPFSSPRSIGFGVQVAAEQLERRLERLINPNTLQKCLASAHAGAGCLKAAVDELRSQLRNGDSGARPELLVSPCDPAYRSSLKTPICKTHLPDVSSQPSEVQYNCVHCRLPMKLKVTNGVEPGPNEIDAGSEPATQEGGACDEMENAYATLFYGGKVEYLLGALVVGWSLKDSGSTVRRVLLHTDDVPSTFLDLLGFYWELRSVPYLDGSEKMFKNFHISRFQSVFTKLQALNLTEFRKVIMLDIDMLIRGPMDGLFQLSPPGALKRASGRDQPDHGKPYYADDLWRNDRSDMCSGINAGVMLLQPDDQVYERMVSEIKDDQHPEHIGSYGPEQDYLSRFYGAFGTGAWSHIHAKYNYQLMLPDDYVSKAHKALDIRRDVVVAHYSGPRVKPWKIVQKSKDADIGAEELESLLYDDDLRTVLGQPTSSRSRPSQKGKGKGKSKAPRERIMDGVVVVDDQNAGDCLPHAVQHVMWEWVLALRECQAELEQADLDLVGMVRARDVNWTEESQDESS